MSELTITEPIMPGSMLDLATREVERLSGLLAAAEARAEQAERERDALREALGDAAQSLETIRSLGGHDDTGLDDMLSVRCYANSRATVARAALNETARDVAGDGKDGEG
jgi:hypothetical protein